MSDYCGRGDIEPYVGVVCQDPWQFVISPNKDARTAASSFIHCVPHYPTTFIHFYDLTNKPVGLRVIN